MTKDKTVTMSRELAERIYTELGRHPGPGPANRRHELQELLDNQSCGACKGCADGCRLDRESPPAAPVVERQEPLRPIPISKIYFDTGSFGPIADCPCGNKYGIDPQYAGQITIVCSRCRKEFRPVFATPYGKAVAEVVGGEYPVIEWTGDEDMPPSGTKLYASPPAPVAVVLPPRKSMPLRDDYSSDEDGTEEFFEAAVRVKEHNACLDKVKELNNGQV